MLTLAEVLEATGGVLRGARAETAGGVRFTSVVVDSRGVTSGALFVALKGLAIPFLILLLNDYRQRSPVLAMAGMILVTFGLTVAVGQWLGWATAFLRVHGVPAF